MKRCSHCDELLPLEEFHLNSRTKDGLRSECKACRKNMAFGKWWTNLTPKQQIEEIKKARKLMIEDA